MTGALNAQLLSDKHAVLPAGAHCFSGLRIPPGAVLLCEPGAVILPAHQWANVIRVHAGASLLGAVFDARNFGGVLVDVDGDDQAHQGFGLHVRTCVDMEARGSFGPGNGTALSLHADGLPTARVMGVDATVRVYGMTYGARMRQTSLDGSQFVNACTLDVRASETWQALQMDTPAGGYHLDGNTISVQHQPLIGAGVPSCLLAGQLNAFDLLPWDWDSMVGPAVVLAPAARKNRVTLRCAAGHFVNNSDNGSNAVLTA